MRLDDLNLADLEPALRRRARAILGAVGLRRAVEEILRWTSPTSYNRRTEPRRAGLRRLLPVLAGEVEWARSNKHNGVRRLPVRLEERR
jgi:hypothetical protein